MNKLDQYVQSRNLREYNFAVHVEVQVIYLECHSNRSAKGILGNLEVFSCNKTVLLLYL